MNKNQENYFRNNNKKQKNFNYKQNKIKQLFKIKKMKQIKKFNKLNNKMNNNNLLKISQNKMLNHQRIQFREVENKLKNQQNKEMHFLQKVENWLKNNKNQKYNNNKSQNNQNKMKMKKKKIINLYFTQANHINVSHNISSKSFSKYDCQINQTLIFEIKCI
ncbi:unnamed protein product [Paramecium sonneborni]|uniref:Uncharacterized protein n=1 Tax=Paramecium sonneborni TaxID=65129 RepID=A0A8S1NA72_9CILI|nr:unnamed protein product [Paramecium sonneborni]